MMKPLMLLGALLVTLGILALIAESGVVRYTSDDKLPHDGKTHITVKEEKILSISPLWAGLALAAGATLMIVAARK
jgi:hypothetical protein